MVQHSILGASASHRWLNCPGSVRMTKDLPEESSEYADEGTRAHELCAYCLAKKLGRPLPEIGDESQYDADMRQYATEYANFVAEKVTADTQIFIEQHVDYSKSIHAPEGFGTADCILIEDGVSHIIDFKYGLGVRVDAVRNTQMMLYALGALESFDLLYDIRSFELTIYQPRISNISTWSITTDELRKAAEELFAPAAKAAMSECAPCAAGEWCRFCGARAWCRAHADETADVIAMMEKALLPPELSDQEINDVLRKADAVRSWLKSVEDFALECALRGKEWQGFKLTEGRGVRKFTDPEQVAAVLSGIGVEPYRQDLRTLTDIEKTLGKKKFAEVLGSLVTKVAGAQKLMPVK